jgi:RNA-directed DNA polymerase
MGWRGVERLRNMTPRASGQTSIGSCITQERGQLLAERRQRTAGTPRTGALSPGPVAWHTIAWYAVHRTVRRLQARLVQAVQAGRWGKGQAVHHLLTHSCRGKALAVQRVTTTHGRQTPGVDGMVWDTPEQTARALGALRPRGYRALPLRRVDMPQNDGTQRQRPLSIPTRPDRALQAFYLRALEPMAATRGAPHASGVRTERSTAEAIEPCFNVLARKHAPPWSGEGARRVCCDGSSHDGFLASIPMETAM